MLHATRVRSEKDLAAILALQQANHRGVKTPEEEKAQGFLTVCHSLQTLQQMHALEPSIIVKDIHELVGFALVMPVACSQLVPELLPMFEGLEKIIYHNKPLSAYRYYVMGQICVAQAYRGQGVFDMLYHHHHACLRSNYDFVITEIATRNTRSMRAHERVGFKQLQIQQDDLDEWAVVIWHWN